MARASRRLSCADAQYIYFNRNESGGPPSCGRISDPMLLFKKKFIEPIREGTKTQTIRLWKSRRYRAGQRSYIPGAGYIRITAVDPVDIDALTDEDARPDGFATAESLRAELRSLYAEKLDDGYSAWRVVFHLLPPEEQAAIRAEKAAANAAAKKQSQAG